MKFSYLLKPKAGSWTRTGLNFSPFYLDALNAVADTNLGRNITVPLIQGSLSPNIDYARDERAQKELQNAGLNESQIQSVAMSYATDLLHLFRDRPGPAILLC